MIEYTDEDIAVLIADKTLDPEQGAADHIVPADLLELFEVLEWQKALDQRLKVAPRGVPSPGTIRLRGQWGARPARYRTRLDNPQGCAFHHVGARLGSFPHDSCDSKVRGFQAFHMDGRGWSDIAYNFLGCPHGVVYEGRGIDVRSAANGTDTGNSLAHAICAISGEGDHLTPELFIALKAARQALVNGGTGTRTWVHGDFKATSCPDPRIRAWQRAGMPTDGEPTPTPPPTPPTTPPTANKCGDPGGHPLLRRGTSGRAVNHVQFLLQKTGAKIAGDGMFGLATENAVRNFQTWANFNTSDKLTSDGVVGPKTWATLHRHVDGLVV